MFKWLRGLFALRNTKAFTRNIYKEMDEKRKERREVWHYTCENGHKWKSNSSPTSTFCRDNYGMKETACPKCNSTICMGSVYINGKFANMGAIHCGFGKGRKNG